MATMIRGVMIVQLHHVSGRHDMMVGLLAQAIVGRESAERVMNVVDADQGILASMMHVVVLHQWVTGQEHGHGWNGGACLLHEVPVRVVGMVHNGWVLVVQASVGSRLGVEEIIGHVAHATVLRGKHVKPV